MERGTVMEINYKDIGVRVKQERINKNITQEKLAELSGVSVTHMSNIENANTKLSLPVLINIANALDCDSSILLFENSTSNLNSSLLINNNRMFNFRFTNPTSGICSSRRRRSRMARYCLIR